jgi:translocation and assembly module TamA
MAFAESNRTMEYDARLRSEPMPVSRQRLALAVALLCATGCAARPHPRSPVPPGQSSIGEIELTGADHIDIDELRDGLAIVRAKELGQSFAAYMVALDRQRIQGFYDRRGYFSATVTSKLDRTPERVDVSFTIVEGPRAKLARVDIIGLPPEAPITAAELRRRLPLGDGDGFDYETYDLARPSLVTALQNEGYASARVSGLVLADRERSEAVLRLTVDLGPLSTFGPVTVEGIEGELAESVRGRLRFGEGDSYSGEKVEDTRADLYDYGRFALVRIDLDTADRNPIVPVKIVLGLAPPNELRLGGGFGVNPVAYETRAQAVYTRAGWPTTLTSTRLELRPAVALQRSDTSELQPRVDAVAGVDRVDLFFPRVRGTVEAAFTYLSLEAYTDYGPRFRLGARAPLYRRIVQGSVGWQLQLLKFRDLDEAISDTKAAQLEIDKDNRLGFYEQSIFIELRDNPITPRQGLYSELRFEEGTVAAGGAFSYVRIIPDLRSYLSFGPVTLATRGRLGFIFGDIPATQRFFGGGANSQRGFAERQLSPFATDVTTDPDTLEETTRRVVIGGGASLELSAELRFPLFEIKTLPIGGVVFVDGTDVTERTEDLDPTNLHLATGAGLRALTPIGSVRFDFGYRVNRRASGEAISNTNYAYHLSIGEAF